VNIVELLSPISIPLRVVDLLAKKIFRLKNSEEKTHAMIIKKYVTEK